MKRTSYSSTYLDIGSRHCLRALDYADAHAPTDRDVFAVGTAAHACLEAVAMTRQDTPGGILTPEQTDDAMNGICETLITTGRSFAGHPEPPLPSEAVWQGRDIARRYLELWPIDDGKGWRYEVGLGVNQDWRQAPYRGAWLRCVIDAIGEEYRQELGCTAVVVRDYKSSWRAGYEDVHTIQRRIQAVVAAIWHPTAEAIVTQIVNLRTGRCHEEVVLPHEPEGAARLRRWQRDIEAEIRKSAPPKGDRQRPATPGVRCMGCPYLGRCDAATGLLDAVHGESAPGVLADAYAVATAQRKALADWLKPHLADGEVETASGGTVGYRPTSARRVIEGAEDAIWASWVSRQQGMQTVEGAFGLARSLLRTVKLSTQQLRSIAARRWPGKDRRDKREAWVEEHTEAAPQRALTIDKGD